MGIRAMRDISVSVCCCVNAERHFNSRTGRKTGYPVTIQ